MIYCKQIMTAIFCSILLVASYGWTANTEIISEGEMDGKFLFRVNGVVVMASEGDIIDDCTVSRQGLVCNDSLRTLSPKSGGIAAEFQALRSEKERCEDELTRADQSCHERYQANILDFTEALKKKNYELAEKTKEIEKLKANPSVRAMQLTPVDEQFVAIRRNLANFRLSPSLHAAVVSQGVEGDIFSVIAKSEDGWYQVRLDDGSTGWVAAGLVSLASPYAQRPLTATIATTKRACHIRAAANSRSFSVGLIPVGETLTILEQTDNWLKVSRKKGDEGWIHRSMAREEKVGP